jgi:hypothetical protein
MGDQSKTYTSFLGGIETHVTRDPKNIPSAVWVLTVRTSTEMHAVQRRSRRWRNQRLSQRSALSESATTLLVQILDFY